MSDYEVGRGKPPKHAQFRAGQSGNPRGRRPKPPRAELPSQLGRDVRAVGRLKTTVKTPNGPRHMTLAEALIYRLWMDAIAGKISQQRMLVALLKDAYADVLEKRPNMELFDRFAVDYPDIGSRSQITRELLKSISAKSREW